MTTFCEKNSIKYELNGNDYSATVVSFDENAENILIPNSINYENQDYLVKSIKKSIRNKNKKLKSISFSSTTNISIFDDYSFYECAITEISIPDSVIKIGIFAFCWCNNLQKINISPNSHLQEICRYAFVDVPITSLYIPSGLKTLQDGWCDRAPKLNNIIISPDNHNFIFYQDKYMLGKSDPNSDIYDFLILSRRDIEEAIIPSFITEIGPHSFNKCLNIKTVKFEPNSQLKTIGNRSFRDSSIKTIKIPSKVERIDSECFYCSSLQKVDFESNSELKTIGGNSFSQTNIREISIPSSIINLGSCSFTDCRFLKRMKFEYNKNTENCNVDSNLILGSPVTHLVFPPNYVSFGYYSINMCPELSFIEFLADNVEFQIDNFRQCPKLIAVSFPNANNVILYKQKIQGTGNCIFYFKPNANVIFKENDDDDEFF